jgi:hypothetical protein
VAHLAALVRRACAGSCYELERATLGAGDPGEVAATLGAFLAEELAPLGDALFYRRGTGVVAGVLLADGREVVIKVHRWHASLARLASVQAVQRHLAGAGLPAPRPLLSPRPLGSGIATVEELRRGGTADGRRPVIRRAVARLLSELVVSSRSLPALPALGTPPLFDDLESQRWPEPHDLRFDFVATSRGAAWIDELAWRARERLRGLPAEPVVGHFDWCVGNLGFARDTCSAIYDWDSIAIAPEALLAGAAAAQFCTDWARGGRLPSVAEMRAFVAEYEQARGEAFDAGQRQLLDAANMLLVAYGARCQHSDVVLAALPGARADGGWMALLRERVASAPL